ncbi:MAG: hypothetical protein R6U32_02515, partial [Candidatus Woesearchaeota archaeon]
MRRPGSGQGTRKKELLERIMLCQEYKEEVRDFSRRLNVDYKKGLISEEEYRQKLSKSLGGKTKREWLDYYDDYISRCRKEMQRIDAEKEKKRMGIRNSALLIIGLAIVMSAVLFFSPRHAGYAVLDDAEIITGKDTYNVGDMAHLFVMPPEAEYEVEVYGPGGKLYASALNFPVEKPGNYSVKASIIHKNMTREVHSSFEVVEEDDNATQEITQTEQGSQDEENKSHADIPATWEDASSNTTTTNRTAPQEDETAAGNDTSTAQAGADHPESGGGDTRRPPVHGLNISLSREDARIENVREKGRNKSIIRFSESGLELDIEGAELDDVGNVRFERGILHVDSFPIESAEIRIPGGKTAGITTTPELYVRENPQDEFRPAEPYKKDGRWYNKVKAERDYYEFSVEHFSDYYVNSAGYGSLQACLVANNYSFTAECIIDQPDYYEVFVNDELALNASLSGFNTSGLALAYDFVGVQHEFINASHPGFNKSGLSLAYDFELGLDDVTDLSGNENNGS